MPTDLHCRACGREYEAGADEPWRCTCGHALDFDEQPIPGGDPPPFDRLDTRRGLWTFFEFIPIEGSVTLGEGFTPLVDAPEWNAQFKLEYVSPTGSFKDRGATTTLSRAVELGVDTVVEDSSGNAGAAIATYAARAGIDAEIYVPAGIKQSKLMAIQRAGARPVPVEGSREDVHRACIEAVEDGNAWYASHAWNPAFFAGTATFAMEVAAQRDWSVPEAVVLPVGHGTLYLGAYRGFSYLQRAGLTDRMPRLYGAQATGYAPVVEDFHGTDAKQTPPNRLTTALGNDDEESEPNEVADGIHVREPARREQIREAVTDTGGDVVAVGESALEGALDRLHRAGFYTEPTCAVAPAALREFREEGVIDEDADVVVPLTGSGLKTM